MNARSLNGTVSPGARMHLVPAQLRQRCRRFPTASFDDAGARTILCSNLNEWGQHPRLRFVTSFDDLAILLWSERLASVSCRFKHLHVGE
jgi:hypothetical protein